MPQREQTARLAHTDRADERGSEPERNELLETSKQAYEKINRILESITDVFFSLDRDWQFTYLNREAQRLPSLHSSSGVTLAVGMRSGCAQKRATGQQAEPPRGAQRCLVLDEE